MYRCNVHLQIELITNNWRKEIYDLECKMEFMDWLSDKRIDSIRQLLLLQNVCTFVYYDINSYYIWLHLCTFVFYGTNSYYIFCLCALYSIIEIHISIYHIVHMTENRQFFLKIFYLEKGGSIVSNLMFQNFDNQGITRQSSLGFCIYTNILIVGSLILINFNKLINLFFLVFSLTFGEILCSKHQL
jgi:hypothetical protein